MIRNILIIIFSACLILACGDGAKSGGQKSAMNQGKSFLSDGDRLRESGDKIEAKKYYKKAAQEFEKEVRKDANQAGLASLLGQSQYRIRDFDNAIQWLTKATAQNKEDAVSQQYLGYSLINKTKIKEAEQAFKKAFFLDKTGEGKKSTIKELTDIGELSLNLGNNFMSQGSQAQGVEFKKLGMRIMAMALEYSKYDLKLAGEIKNYAVEMNDQILIDWISNVITSEEEKSSSIEIKK